MNGPQPLIGRVRHVQHHERMLLLVQCRQGYTLVDVRLVPVRIHAIDVHSRFIAVDLQAVRLSIDELGAMRAMMQFLTHAHG